MNFNLDWRSESSSYQNACGGEQMSPKLGLIPECGTACEQAEEMSSEVCPALPYGCIKCTASNKSQIDERIITEAKVRRTQIFVDGLAQT